MTPSRTRRSSVRAAPPAAVRECSALGPANCPFVAASEIGYMHVGGPNKFTCFDPGTGAPTPCNPGGTWESNAWVGPTGWGAGKAANWDAVWNGNNNGPLNEVKPGFANLALSDEFRPSDQVPDRRGDPLRQLQLLASRRARAWPISLRRYQVANYYCVNPSHNNTVLVTPLTPGTVPPAVAALVTASDRRRGLRRAYKYLYPGGTVTTGWVHPNGKAQDGVSAPTFTNQSPSGYDQFYYSPRLAFTFTQNPDTVWRFSAGRYTEPPLSAATQYLYSSGSGATNLWANFMGDGFYSPFHPLPGMSTGQYDLSFEHHFHASPWSIKITPFYTHTTNWEQQAFIGSGFVTQVPVGQFQSEGAEMALTAGDFTRNGLSGQLSFTYTHAAAQFQNLLVPNHAGTMNTQIKQFNALTKAGGGSPCYAPFNGSTVVDDGVQQSQGHRESVLQHARAGSARSQRLVSSLHLQLPPAFGPELRCRRRRATPRRTCRRCCSTGVITGLAITPSLQFESGAKLRFADGRCRRRSSRLRLNQTQAGVVNANGQYCDYLHQAGVGATGYLYIPNPQTGSFATFGQYTEPNILAGNMQIRYDVSPRITLTATAANIFHSCFGGSSTPWSAAIPAESERIADTHERQHVTALRGLRRILQRQEPVRHQG